MKNRLFKLIVLGILAISCGVHYSEDLNSYVAVTSKYDDGPEILVTTSIPKPLADCLNLSEVQCAEVLYNDSLRYIEQGDEFIYRQLYVSAKVEFMQALCRLEAAKIKLSQDDSGNYLELEEKIEEKIKLCDRRMLVRPINWR